MRIDLHTHSIASGHGTTDTVTDLAKAAATAGITLLGISEHAPAMLGAARSSYFMNLSHLPHVRFGAHLLYGAELNILSESGNVDLDYAILNKLDYCIASIHAPIFKNHDAYAVTRAYIGAMKHPGVCIIGHPDDTHFPVLPKELVQAAKEHHVLLEINNASLSPAGYRGDSALIDRQILSCCAEMKAPVIIGSDSHGRQHIGEDTYARKLFEEISFPSELIANDHPDLLAEYLPERTREFFSVG